MNCQADIAAIVRAKRKTGFSVDGSVYNRYGNCQEITLLPVKQFLQPPQFPALLHSLTGESETVKYLPIHLFGVDGGGILQLGQIVIKGYAHLCQLLLAFGLLAALQHGVQVVFRSPSLLLNFKNAA